jgi:hypothetical protein
VRISDERAACETARRMSRARTARLVGAVVAVVLVLSPPADGAALGSAQVETTVPTVATAAAAPSSSPSTAAEQVDAGTDADTDDGSTTVVGDPVADRRIRRIVIGLCAVAALVLIVTVLFWRATRPVPRALQGLQALGSRSGRRRAVAASAASSDEAVSPPVPPALVPATSTASLPDDG